MVIGMIPSSSGRNSTSHNRPAKANVLLCALALGAAFAIAQPFPSFLLDTTRYIGRDINVAGCHIALAASEAGGAIVWGGTAWRGRASRLSRAMGAVDTIPTDIVGPWDDFLSAPAVARSDSGYAVAWNGYAGLAVALVSVAGEVTHRVLLDAEVQVHSVAIAARSDRYVVVYDGWFPSSGSMDVRATEVALDGTILRRTPVVRGEGMTPNVASSAAARGDSTYLAVFQGPYGDTSDINGRLIMHDNPSADTQVIPIRHGCSAFGPRATFDGENFWVAWLEESVPDAETVAKVARVTQGGVLLDTGGIVVGSEVKDICLAAARETTLVTLSVPENVIVGMRYDGEAQLLDSTPIPLSIHAVTHPVAAVAADTFLVVWREVVEGVSEATERLAGRRLTASGMVVDPGVRGYAFSANNHDADHVVDAPIIASDGEYFLAVWSDERADPDYSARLLGRRFDNQGRFLDAGPFTITDPSSTPLRPVLTYGAGCYFLCWFEGSTASYAVRISPQGEVMDTVPIPLPSASQFSAFDATFLRDSTFVILGGDTTTLVPLVVRVTGDGRVLDSVPRVIKVRWAPECTNRHPSIASMGDTLVMVCRLYDTYTAELFLAVGLYDRSLKQYDSIWWPPKPNYLNPWRTSVACGGGRILAASDPRNRSAKPELWLLDSVGHVLLDTIAIPNPCGWGNNFCIGYDGGNFLCVKSGEGLTGLPGSRISPDGEVLDKPAVSLVRFESTLVTGHSGLARDTLGNVGLVFFAFESEGYMSDRIRAAVFPRLTDGLESPHQFSGFDGLEVRPNPARGAFSVHYDVPYHSSLSVGVYDASGRLVRSLSDEVVSPGRYEARIPSGALPAGIYFLRLDTPGFRSVKKAVVAR